MPQSFHSRDVLSGSFPRPSLFALLAALIVFASTTATWAESPADWKNLLPEGEPLSTHWTTTGNWELKEGIVRLSPRPGESGWTRYDAYLWHTKTYKNFEIDFEYQVQPKGNSGFYFHVGDLKDPVNQGIEVQIYDSYSTNPQAKLTDHTSGGVIPGIAPAKNTAKPAGEWNRFQITVKNDTLTIALNGETVNTVDLNQGKLAGRPKTGYIGFQDHGLPLALRNIKIRQLK